MAYTKRDFVGGAPTDTLASGITNSSSSLTGTSAGSMPAGGANGDFFIAIGSANGNGTFTNLEVIRCASRSGNTYTVQSGGRGADNTSAVAHDAGETIYHCMTALDAYEANHHIADTTLDHHTQYLNTTRHDTTTRHSMTTVIPTSATTPAATSTSPSAGSGSAAAFSNHSHAIGALSVVAGSYAALSIATGDIAALAVTAAKIAANTITAGQIAGSTLTPTQMANSMLQQLHQIQTTVANYVGSLTEGVRLYETTNHREKRYNGSAWDTVALTHIGSAAPADLSEGVPWYDSTLHQLKFYQGATDTWQQAWNQPWGTIAYAQAVTPQGSITTIVDLTSLTTGSITYIANRRIRVSAFVPMNSSGAGDSCGLAITDGSNVIKAEGNINSNTNGISFGNTVSFVTTTTAGAVTYKARGYRGAGGGSVVAGDGSLPFYILVEDIGPNGAPS